MRREAIAAELRAIHARHPWVAWARLHLPAEQRADGSRRFTAGIILGRWPEQPARRDIEDEHGVVLSADGEEAYLLAPKQEHIDAAVEGIEQRIPDAELVDGQAEEAPPPFGDRYAGVRSAPCAQVAPAPPLDLDTVLDQVGDRLRRLRALFTR